MKKRIGFVICNIIFLVLSIFSLIYGMNFPSDLKIEICYGEEHPNRKAVLYYNTNYKVLGSDAGIEGEIKDEKAVLLLGDMELSDMRFRLDPIDAKERCTLTGLYVYNKGFKVLSLDGEELKEAAEKIKQTKKSAKNGIMKLSPKTDDPYLLLSKSFSERLDIACNKVRLFPLYICIILYIVTGILYFVTLAKSTSDMCKKKTILEWGAMVVGNLSVCIGIVINYIFAYFQSSYGNVPFGQLLYHINTPLDGTNVSNFSDIIIKVVCLTVLIFVAVAGIYLFLKKKNRQKGFAFFAGILGVMFMARAVTLAIEHFDLLGYYQYTKEKSEIYEKYYADGKEMELKFPEKKRNLIYIFLESMEITYASQSVGGGMQENLIPELTELALKNGCFSGENQLNGAYQVQGATFTMGALAAQTSGVPINVNLVGNDTVNSNWESENNYLPGVYAIGDVLKQEGYKQRFLIGSDAKFAGRSSYFSGHGDYEIFDYYTAIEKAKIDPEYKVWWGYEDAKLFEYAKEEITKMSEGKEPFNCTMLTVDTHFTGGYLCEKCENQYEDQYSNVIACSSRQVAEFIAWIKEQEFYDNTTIVISGDHLTMDSAYTTQHADSFDRRVFTTIINPADGCVMPEKQRSYTTLDLYPTTLAAMGVEIPGNRLGLGVNLYSDLPTLAEEYGIDALNIELLKNSNYYTNKLLYK